MTNEILKADIPYRNKLFAIYLGCIALVILFIQFVIPRGLTMLRTMSFRDAEHSIEIILILFLCCFSPAAIYLIILGKKVLRHKAFPFPGMKVIRDTVIHTGRNAQLRGKAFMYLGIIFLVLMCAGICALLISFNNFLALFS